MRLRSKGIWVDHYATKQWNGWKVTGWAQEFFIRLHRLNNVSIADAAWQTNNRLFTITGGQQMSLVDLAVADHQAIVGRPSARRGIVRASARIRDDFLVT